MSSTPVRREGSNRVSERSVFRDGNTSSEGSSQGLLIDVEERNLFESNTLEDSYDDETKPTSNSTVTPTIDTQAKDLPQNNAVEKAQSDTESTALQDVHAGDNNTMNSKDYLINDERDVTKDMSYRSKDEEYIEVSYQRSQTDTPPMFVNSLLNEDEMEALYKQEIAEESYDEEEKEEEKDSFDATQIMVPVQRVATVEQAVVPIQRRASQDRRDALSLFNKMKRHSPDCGLPGKPFHLSRAAAKEVSAQLSVGQVNEKGEKVDLPLSTNLGWYPLPCTLYDPTVKDALEECGPGIVHYFKLLKSLIVLFVIMSLISVPSILMNFLANVTEPPEKAFASKLHTQVALAYTTIGSLGEPLPSCRQVPENSTFSFRCPSGGKISSIVSYYGQPYGSCGCPENQLPISKGVCSGTSRGQTLASKYVSVSDAYNYKGQHCVASPSGSVSPCFVGFTRYSTECCSIGLDGNGFADLTSLAIAPNPGCNSFTAPFIIEALCLGNSTCNLPISIDSPINVPLDKVRPSLRKFVCISDDGVYCRTTLRYGGSFTNCSSSSVNSLIFEGICFVSEVSGTATVVDGMKHSDIVYYSSLLDFAGIVVFLIGILFIRVRQDDSEFLDEKSMCRASDYTVECKTFPHTGDHNVIIQKVRDHFETVLSQQPSIRSHLPIQIADINLGTAHHQYIRLACQRGKLARKVDRLIGKCIMRLRLAQFNFSSWKDIGLLNSLKRALFNYEIVNRRCEYMQHAASADLSRVYITFETEEGVLRCLKAYSTYGFFGRLCQKPEFLFEGQPVVVKRARDPSEIRWENVGVPVWSRVLRTLCTTFLTLSVLAVSYILIFEALTLVNNSEKASYNIACSTYNVSINSLSMMGFADANTITYQKVLEDHNWKAYNRSSSASPQGYLLCFCQQLNYEIGFESMKNYKFDDVSSGSQQTWCSTLVSAEQNAEILTYIATAIIIAINVSIHQFLGILTKFERPVSDTAEVISVALKLCLAQYINTGLLSLVIYGNLFRVGGSGILLKGSDTVSFGLFAGKYRDFDVAWYAAVGASILFTMSLYILGSPVLVIMKIILKRFLQKFDEFSCCYFSRSTTHKQLQVDLEQLYLEVEFSFETQLATLVTLVLVCLTYSATMPLMNAICCASLIFLFLVNKYFILRFHSLPAAYSIALTRIMTQLLYAAALLHSAFGAWMFGNRTFSNPDFQHEDSTFIVSNSSFLMSTHSWESKVSWVERGLNENSFLLLGVAVCLVFILLTVLISGLLHYFFGLHTIDDFLDVWIFNNSQRRFRGMVQNLPPYFNTLPIALLHNRIHSGVITGALREKYSERLGKLLTKEERLPPKLMEGLESYRLALSAEYSVKFGLDSFYMRRVPPTDWIVSNENRNSKLYIGTDRRSKRASLQRYVKNVQDAFVGIEEHEKQIEEILSYCCPLIVDSNNIQMRSQNVFYRGANYFDNDSQTGQRVFIPGVTPHQSSYQEDTGLSNSA